MSVRTVSLNDVSVTDKATHIVIYQGSSIPSNTNDNMISELKTQVFNLTRQVEELSKKLLHLELGLPKASPFFSANVAPEPEGLEVRRLSEIPRVVETSNSSVVFKAVVSKLPASSPPAPTLMEVDDEGEVEEAGEAASAAGEEEEAEAEEAGEAEEEEASEAGEDEAEEEALELEEFEYKGVTYFKDSENQVYEKDDDGDLNDTPIGVWNEEKKKVLKYKS
jgi:hypothetical protein